MQDRWDQRSDQEDVIAYNSSIRIDGCAVTTTCPLQFQQATSLSTGVRPATSHVSQCQAAITTYGPAGCCLTGVMSISSEVPVYTMSHRGGAAISRLSTVSCCARYENPWSEPACEDRRRMRPRCCDLVRPGRILPWSASRSAHAIITAAAWSPAAVASRAPFQSTNRRRQDVTAHWPRLAFFGPSALGRTSKSKIWVGR